MTTCWRRLSIQSFLRRYVMSDKHNPTEVIGRSLTSEECYFLLRFAEHLGYKRAIRKLDPPIWRTMRRWIIWFGGWETCRLTQWDRGVPKWRFSITGGRGNRIWKNPFPLGLFGHRISIQTFGINFRVHGGYLCLHKSSWYWSPNGTPQHDDAKHLRRRHRCNERRRANDS